MKQSPIIHHHHNERILTKESTTTTTTTITSSSIIPTNPLPSPTTNTTNTIIDHHQHIHQDDNSSSYQMEQEEEEPIVDNDDIPTVVVEGNELLAMINDDTTSSSSVGGGRVVIDDESSTSSTTTTTTTTTTGTLFIPADIYDDDEIIVASDATFIPVVNPSGNNSMLAGVHFPNQILYFTSKNGTNFRFIPFLELIQEMNSDNTWSNVQLSNENPQNNFEKTLTNQSDVNNNSSITTTNTTTNTTTANTNTTTTNTNTTNTSSIVTTNSKNNGSSEDDGNGGSDGNGSNEMIQQSIDLFVGNSINKRKREEQVESEKKVKTCPLELVDLPVHIKLKILGYLHVPFMECYRNYQNYELNISRIFGKFKNDPFSIIYLIYTSLGMKLKQQYGSVLPIAKRTKDLRILVDPKISNLNFINGFAHLQKLSIWLTDSNLMNLFQKQTNLFPKIVYLSLVLFNDLSDTHYSETFLKMPNLRTLQIFSDLERCSIKAKVNLPPRLTTLRLLNYEFIDFSFICHNTQITSLSVVDSCNLSNIDKISSLTQLKRLKINEEETIDGRNLDLNAIFQLETLERLSIPLVSFKYRLNGLTKLHSLRIHIGDDLNLVQIEQYANYILECKSLKRFKFEMSEDCPIQIQNKFLEILSKHSSIEYLKTSSLITSNQVIKYIFQSNRFPSLEEIDFSNAEDLTIEPFKILVDSQLFKKQFKRVILPMNFNSAIEEGFGALLPNTKFNEDFNESYEYFDVCDFDDDDSDDEDTRSIISELISNADGASYYDSDSDDEILEHLIGH